MSTLRSCLSDKLRRGDYRTKTTTTRAAAEGKWWQRSAEKSNCRSRYEGIRLLKVYSWLNRLARPHCQVKSARPRWQLRAVTTMRRKRTCARGSVEKLFNLFFFKFVIPTTFCRLVIPGEAPELVIDFGFFMRYLSLLVSADWIWRSTAQVITALGVLHVFFRFSFVLNSYYQFHDGYF